MELVRESSPHPPRLFSSRHAGPDPGRLGLQLVQGSVSESGRMAQPLQQGRGVGVEPRGGGEPGRPETEGEPQRAAPRSVTLTGPAPEFWVSSGSRSQVFRRVGPGQTGCGNRMWLLLVFILFSLTLLLSNNLQLFVKTLFVVMTSEGADVSEGGATGSCLSAIVAASCREKSAARSDEKLRDQVHLVLLIITHLQGGEGSGTHPEAPEPSDLPVSLF